MTLQMRTNWRKRISHCLSLDSTYTSCFVRLLSTEISTLCKYCLLSKLSRPNEERNRTRAKKVEGGGGVVFRHLPTPLPRLFLLSPCGNACYAGKCTCKYQEQLCVGCAWLRMVFDTLHTTKLDQTSSTLVLYTVILLKPPA